VFKLFLVQCSVFMLATSTTQLLVHYLIKCPSYTLFQALYYCIPFREQLLEYSANYKNPGEAEENLLTCLADLFTQVKKTSLSDILLHFLCCCSLVCISVLPLSLSSRCTHGFHVIVFGKNKNIVTLKIIHFTSSVSLLID
jgi:hypothetical protein